MSTASSSSSTVVTPPNNNPSSTITMIVEEDLPMQIDCVSWNPRHANLLAIGAYQLDEQDTSVRYGRIYLVKLTKSVPGGFKVVNEYQVNGGVLDLKWDEFNESDDDGLLCVGSSTGIYFLKLIINSTNQDDSFELKLQGEIILNSMALYIQWIVDDNSSGGGGGGGEKKVIFSDSEGKVNIIRINEDFTQFNIIQSKKLHEALTWVLHYSYEQDVLYSGCDDGKFTAFNMQDLDRDEFHYTKQYLMGVTSITSRNELVAVGSYDDTLRIYNLTATTPKPFLKLQMEINLNGAIWRTIWLPNLRSKSTEDSHLMAVACARNGIQIIELNTENKNIKIIEKCLKYQGNLAYGLDVKVDWRDDCYIIATCYFDNHMLHVFKWQPID